MVPYVLFVLLVPSATPGVDNRRLPAILSPMNLPSSVSTYWQKHRIWDRYREEQHPVIGKALQEQRELVVNTIRDFARGRPAPLSVADLGCGTGRVAHDLLGLECVQRLLAVDINEQAVRRVAAGAAKLGLQARLLTRSGDFYSLQWSAEDVFDVVLCMDVLHHLPDIPRMLAIIRGRVKPGGMFIGNIRSAEGTALFFNRYGPVKRLLIALQPTVNRRLPERSFLRRWLGSIGYLRIRTFTRTEAESLLTQTGFKVEKLQTSFYHWFCCATA